MHRPPSEKACAAHLAHRRALTIATLDGATHRILADEWSVEEGVKEGYGPRDPKTDTRPEITEPTVQLVYRRRVVDAGGNTLVLAVVPQLDLRRALLRCLHHAMLAPAPVVDVEALMEKAVESLAPKKKTTRKKKTKAAA